MDLEAIAKEEKRRAQNRINDYFPDTGPLRRELYPKHCEFFAAGAEYNERALIAGNRTGKTIAGAYEMTCHLTGVYPHWWVGKRFDKPIKAWACGQSNKTVRGILQEELLGKPNARGTGMLPGDLIVHQTAKAGIAEAVDTIYVKHATGGASSVTLKSYEEGAASYFGQAIDVVWADEEPPMSIWTEMLVRTMTTNGICYLTTTPLFGLTEVILSFLPNGTPD